MSVNKGYNMQGNKTGLSKRDKAKIIQKIGKRRNKYKAVFKEIKHNSQDMYGDFDKLIASLMLLNDKTLQILLSDLHNNGAIFPWTGDYHRQIMLAAEFRILERNLLK